ncbi:acetylornithine deacetylase [Alphaproteobacteria bacterium 46_93_T64]|nr:acetylornithine deacetylase [Alphaproteobacteria bacterium 46_93_T64]
MSLPPFIDWIDGQQDQMVRNLQSWSNINSGSLNLSGLALMAKTLEKAFAETEANIEVLPSDPMTITAENGEISDVELGSILRITKRPDANRRVLLCGHMDTVFSPSHPFQICKDPADGQMHGPGTADMKGGLMVMLNALLAFEKSPDCSNLGWQVIINADEEIGSFGSARILAEAAKAAEVGMIFEPSMPDGTFAGARKGSGNFTITVHGRAAHAGREHHLGRNAIATLANVITSLDTLSGQRDGLTVNVGQISGGGALNVVPELAQVRFNVRLEAIEDQPWLLEKLDAILRDINTRDGIQTKLTGGFSRPPKPMTPTLEKLFNLAASCGQELGITVQHTATGGCCDGNNLAAAGLANIDTLGVRGASIHSDQEYMIVDSLAERAKLSALILHRLSQTTDPVFTRQTI